MARVYLNQNSTASVKNYLPKNSSSGGGRVYLNSIKAPVFQQPVPKAPGALSNAWSTFTRNIIKPVASASNALEDIGKGIGVEIARKINPNLDRAQALRNVGFDFLGHQRDVWSGKNQRTYSDITNEIAKDESNPFLRTAIRTTGYGGDFILDPLNKLAVGGLTKEGKTAEKLGKLGLSVAEQSKLGQRALINWGDKALIKGKSVLGGASALNDLLRGTKYGDKVATGLSKVSTAVRPGGVSREEFKVLTDAKNLARNITGEKTSKAIEFGKSLAKTLVSRKATDEERRALLHAIEKGNEKLAPVGFQDLWKAVMDFKSNNETLWKKLGGSVLEGHGLSHVATKEVAEAARKDALRGGKLFSTKTPQDIHRQWVKADGKIVNLGDEGIRYSKRTGNYTKGGKIVKVEQASANEINKAMEAMEKKPIFQEDLPLVAAKMGISTGRKEAGVEFLEATKGLKGEEVKKLVNETYEKISNVESINKAIKGFDRIQNIWKAQALVAPSYHIRNIGGNLWNNYLAGVAPTDYALAAKIQRGISTGKLTKAESKLVKEMEQHGIIGTGQYGGDIAKTISDEVGGGTLNPFSQRFVGYRANKAVGSSIEDNAKIAHFLTKRRGGTAKAAAESVKKFLFDYGDLTWGEQNILKRVMPFYTWTRKNIPLQVQQFFENPGKFSKLGVVKKNIEQGIAQPDEKYMSDYIAGNAPIRTKVDKNGNTLYFLAGAWIPAAQAFQFLTDPTGSALGMVSPAFKLPYENITNQGTFFKNTLGQYDQIQKRPGQKTSYLGLDLNPMTVNNLRSIRVLNELNNLNPGGVFGTKTSPSIFKGIFPNASNVRGGQFSPETTQQDRALNAFFGKLQGYNPEQAKTFYDADTKDKIEVFKAELSRALNNDQTELAQGIIKEMAQFIQERNGQPNKDIEMYNLLGDQYFKDQATNKQAEKSRDVIRQKMREQIREALSRNDLNAVREIMKQDPSYAVNAVRDARREGSYNAQSDEQKKAQYEIEQAKKKYKLNPFYK